MRAVFFGTPATSARFLQATVDAGHEVVAVVTQPDRPRGRGRTLAPPPVKMAACELGTEVLQPERASEQGLLERLRSIAPDVIVVVAYGQKLPNELLDVPPLGAINVHFSLLPELRGAAPVFWAIRRGYTHTGVTTMYMAEAMDAGDIILARDEGIQRDDTTATLEERLAGIGCALLQETLRLVAEARAPRIPQDHDRATRAPIVRKEDGLIDWLEPAEGIERLVRAACPWPVAYTMFEGKLLQVHRARVVEHPGAGGGITGQLIEVGSEAGLSVLTGFGVLEIVEVQAPGRRRMSAAEFARGARMRPGMLLGCAGPRD